MYLAYISSIQIGGIRLRFTKLNPALGHKPISIIILGTLAVIALLFMVSGEVRGDPPQQGDWYIEGDEEYSDVTFIVNGSLQINQTNSLSLENVTLIFNNEVDREFSLNIFGSLYVNSSTIKAADSRFRMGDTDISGTMECRESLIRDFADFRLEEGANFFANDTTISNGRRLFVTQNDLGTVILENSTIGSTENPSNIIVNDRIFFKEVDFPADEVSLGLNGELVVQHYLTVSVENEDGDPMVGSDVDIESILSSFSFLTDAKGVVSNVALTEYTKTSSGTEYDENFTVTVNVPGYFKEIINIRMNMPRSIVISLTPLPDPYVEDSDITVPAQPNEGDFVTINASLHNIGEDASVRIRIYLEDSKGTRTLLNTENLILKDGVTGYAEANWNTTDKKLGTYTVIVEIENRTADRNTSNNIAEKDFYLFTRPIITGIDTDLEDVYRESSAVISVDGEDWETTEENLTLKIQAHPSSGGLWDSSYFSSPFYDGNSWITNFTPTGSAALGDYDFRFRFIDENNGISDWSYKYDYIFVMNNKPEIVSTIPDMEVEEDTELQLDLTIYESDTEDGSSNLKWFVQSYNHDAIFEINGQNSSTDVLTFIPQVNWTGNTSVIIVLTDKDGGMDSQKFHIHWTSVNDAPVLDNISFSTTDVFRTFDMVLLINATDDNTTELNLDLQFQLQLEGDVGWSDDGFGIIANYRGGIWGITITPSVDVSVGNYTLRFNITDDNGVDTGRSAYYVYRIIVLNNPPDIIDITPASGMVMRTDTLVFTVNGTDVETAEEDLQPVIQYRYKKYAYNALNGAWYDQTAGAWSFNFTPAMGAGIGNYTFRAMFIDKDDGSSEWMETLIVVVNNPPIAINLSISTGSISVNNSFMAYANGSDVENSEGDLSAVLELRDEDGSELWSAEYVMSSEFLNGGWVFSIYLPENASLGDYSFRISFIDNDETLSAYLEVTNALHVINNVPIVLNMGIPKEVPRTEVAILYANADCDLDQEKELDAEFMYYHNGQWMDPDSTNSFLTEPIYTNLRWEAEFTPDDLDATMGNYSFRVRFKLWESAWSDWFYLQNGTDVVNSLPVITILDLSNVEVLRGSDVIVNITILDAEDSVDLLTLALEYSRDGTTWETTYLSGLILDNGIFTSTFTPPFTAPIGNYTFRVRGTDTEGEASDWYENETPVWVQNNPPEVIGGAIPTTEEHEDNPLAIRLTPYESDKEDGSIDLDWSVTDYDQTVIIKIIHNPNYDVFTFTPADNFTGETVVWYRLTDSDGDSVIVNGTLVWTSVNDEPIIEQVINTQTEISRGEILTINIEVRDDDDPDADLVPIVHYSLDGESWIIASVTSEMIGGPEDGTIIVNHTVPTSIMPGDYMIRVKVRDTSDNNRTENSTWHYLPHTIEFLNHDPVVTDIELLDEEAYRTDVIEVFVDAMDEEDTLENLTIELAYSYDYMNDTAPGNWTIGYSGAIYYDDIFEYLVIEFIPTKDAPLGKIYLRARVIDQDGGVSVNWSEVMNLTILNNEPEVDPIPEFSTDEDTILVVNLTIYGSDIENVASDLLWYVDWYDNQTIVNFKGNGSTEFSFTPLENFTGSTIITVNLTDLDGAWVTTTVTLTWDIVYEAPRVMGFVLNETYVYRESTLDIIVGVEDDDDETGSLISTLEYHPPSGNWVKLTMSFMNGTWNVPFTPGPTWTTGVYTFRVKFQDSDELESPWVWTNITVLSNPKVVSFSAPKDVYRTHTVTLYVNGSDANDDAEWELTPHFGYSRSNITYSSGAFGIPVYSGGQFMVDFTPGANLIIDRYYVRVRFNDTDGAFSNWKYLFINIRNNAPKIIGTIPDDTATEDVPILLQLEAYGQDDENSPSDLNWSAEWDHGIQQVIGNHTRNLTMIPELDFHGDTLVLLTTYDKDDAESIQYITLSWTQENDAPRVSTLELEADTLDLLGEYIFHTGSNMAAILHDLEDPEDDPISITYSWLVNGNFVVENSTTKMNLSSDNFERGDTVTLRVILSDGTDTRWIENTTTIVNAPPTISGVTITVWYNGEETTTANESSIIRVEPYGYSDLDGEPADFQNFIYEWYDRGTLIASGKELDEINGTVFSIGFDVYCRILPFDGNDYGIGGRSNSTYIFNTPPTIEDITVLYMNGGAMGPNELSTLYLNLSGYSDLDGDIPDPDTFKYSWFVNDLEIGVTTPTLASEYFVKGDEIYCMVTPYDGKVFGLQVTSDSTTIRNTPPTIIDASLNYTGLRPDKLSTVSLDMSGFADLDGDLPNLGAFSYTWFANGLLVGNGPTLDLASYDRGDVIYCVVTPSDGTDLGNPVASENLTVFDTPPSITGASVAITYDGTTVLTANLSCVLTANGENYLDPDGDPEQPSRYSWYINDQFAKTGDTIDGSYFTKGDRVYCLVEPFDGTYYGTAMMTTEIIIENTAPELAEATVITLGKPTRVATITTELIGYYDEDNDPQAVHRYVWFVNGIEIPDQNNATLLNSIKNTYFTKSDVITVEVTPYDGTDYGLPVLSSNNVTIINTAPELTEAVMRWTGDLNATSTLSVDALDFYTDPDGDLFAYFYYEWFVNSDLVQVNFNDNTLSGQFYNRDRVYCRVTPNDGEDNGSAVFTPSVLIQDSPPEIHGSATLISDSLPVTENSIISAVTTQLTALDIDGDRTTFLYRWYVNGILAGAPEENRLSGIYFGKGDRISCRVHAYDDVLRSTSYVLSSEIVIGNTDPVARINRPFDGSFADVNDVIQLDASTSYDPDNGDTLSYQWLVDGEEKATGVTATISLTPGNHIITLIVTDDAGGDDSTQARIHIRASDLLITEERIIFSGTHYEGKTISFVVNIGNIGDGDADDFTAKFFIDGDLIKTFEHISIESSNNETISVDWKAELGTHVVKVVIDTDETNPEMDEDNNEAERAFEISKSPEDEDKRFGIDSFYLNIILGLIVLAVIFGMADLARWKRVMENEDAGSGSDRENQMKEKKA